ncbi:hypothetical protein Hte_006129 [Hypoxylon texense]
MRSAISTAPHPYRKLSFKLNNNVASRPLTATTTTFLLESPFTTRAARPRVRTESNDINLRQVSASSSLCQHQHQHRLSNVFGGSTVSTIPSRLRLSPSTPSASDHPSTPQHPRSSFNTALSAPTSLAIDNSNLVGHLPLSASASASASDSEPDIQRGPSIVPSLPPQVLGRRRRALDDDNDVAGSQSDLSEALASHSSNTDSPRRKRRRADSIMLADVDRSTASNGTSKPYTNGKSHQRPPASGTTNGTHKTSVLNGSSKARQPETYFGHDREEVTRILIQALSDMGYHSAAESVGQESGFELESPTVAAFRNAILEGDWDEAEVLLFGAATPGGRPGESDNGNGLVLADGADRNLMRFWIRQQKFLELLEQRETGRALSVLRTELTPLYQDTQKLHFLSSLLMCQKTEDLKSKADWDGVCGESRRILLSQLSNHVCDRRLFPTETVLELDEHDDQVWQVAFSHDGTKLASCGQGKQVIIWDVASFKPIHFLGDHDQGVGNVAWSWDDTMLVTCCWDRHARLWDVSTGACINKLERFQEPVTSCVWATDNQTFVTGALDKNHSLVQWNLNGDKIYDWSSTHRVEDLAISPDGHWLVASNAGNHIYVYNFVTRELEYQMDLQVRLTSITISQNSRHLLVNHNNGVAQLIDLVLREPVQSYAGFTGGQWMIRSSFGGANESFVISGSEDGSINIWHKASAHLVEKLSGHVPGCNAVTWSPTDPCLFASCGDDGKIKIWSNKNWRRARLEAGRNSGSSP